MPISQPTFKPLSGGTATGATDIQITQINVTSSESSLALQTTLKEIVIRSQGDSDLYVAFVSGGTTGSQYITVKKGCVLSLEGLQLSSKTLYIRSDSNNVVEVLQTYS